MIPSEETQTAPEPTGQAPAVSRNRHLVLLVGAVGAGLVVCALLAWAIVAATRTILPATRGATPTGLVPTRTPSPVREVNSASPLGKFYFGLDGVNGGCQVQRQVSSMSQEDILRSQYIHFSAPFGKLLEGQSVYWSVYGLNGKVYYAGRELALSADSNHCLHVRIPLNPQSPPGEYVVEVRYQQSLAFRKIFRITASDLSKVPRPQGREPFGAISIGRQVEDMQCSVVYQGSTYRLKDLQYDPWFYIVSPFQPKDIGKKFYWSVFTENGDPLFYREEGTIDDDLGLCFWQGFSMEGYPAGTYTAIVEDEQSVVLYKTVFELK
jgi:hypothetical protein